jgi:hypothetical protein
MTVVSTDPYSQGATVTIEFIIFDLASGWMIYREQRQTFLEVNNQPTSPSVISTETTELVLELARAYAAALPSRRPCGGFWRMVDHE